MHARDRRLQLPSLALALVSALGAAPPLPKAQPLAQRSRASSLAARAQSFLLAQEGVPGAGVAGSIQLRNTYANGQGETIARFDQRFLGARVFGSSATVAVHPERGSRLLGRAWESVIQLTDRPKLGADEARRVSHLDLAPLGAYEALPEVELIVFPTRYTGGLKARCDAKTGFAWDRDQSVLAPRPAEAHVWAYEVVSRFCNAEDGLRVMHLIVDARTGGILRKWDATPGFRPKGYARPPRTYGEMARARRPLRIEAAPPALRARACAAPLPGMGFQAGPAPATAATGVGNGIYRRGVALPTSANLALGGFDLWDLSRALNPHSFLPATGILTAYYDFWASEVVPYSMENAAGSLDNVWGDGRPYECPLPVPMPDGYLYIPRDGFHYGDANGQSPAVDAHFAAVQTYDMYKNVLGRSGIDGNDSAVISVVHFDYLLDNAAWDSRNQVMLYGDGTYPFDPKGDTSLTTVDVGAHEMTHGVTGATADLVYELEPGGLNEATSDIASQAVVAYAQRKDSDPVDKIPDVAVPWTMGAEINPANGPLRFFYKPSLDGLSPDAWFYGMSMLDVHYTSGPANRMFYYLCSGAPTDAASDRYSPYLPAGMTGIGLDAGIRIWYKALAEQFTPETDYRGARAGALQAAADLYGAASKEYAAVENAFAAINVGPAHGQNERPLVTFPTDLVASDSPLGQNWGYGTAFSYIPIVPSGAILKLNAKVEHASDTSLTWKAGIGPGFYAPNANADPLNTSSANGAFDSEGYYHSPLNAPTWCGVRAFSRQDPLEWAASPVFVANLDSDGDGDLDALDAGLLALSWGIGADALKHIALAPDPEGSGFVDEFSIQMWGEGFKNASE